jgi:hypothetical protein
MSLTLDLPDDLARELSQEAARLGLPLEAYALRLLAAGCARPGPLRNGADLVAYWQAEGLVGSRPDIADAPQHARALRARAERRDRN